VPPSPICRTLSATIVQPVCVLTPVRMSEPRPPVTTSAVPAKASLSNTWFCHGRKLVPLGQMAELMFQVLRPMSILVLFTSHVTSCWAREDNGTTVLTNKAITNFAPRERETDFFLFAMPYRNNPAPAPSSEELSRLTVVEGSHHSRKMLFPSRNKFELRQLPALQLFNDRKLKL
jgi:hypothetical protein